VSKGMMAWRRGQTQLAGSAGSGSCGIGVDGSAGATRFEVSVSYAVKARRHRARTGSVTPGPQKPCVTHRLMQPARRVTGAAVAGS
jgi:hypothetical protein